MKIGILSITNESYWPVSDITRHVNVEYASSHDYVFNMSIHPPAPWAETVWGKITYLKKRLSEFDWVMWIDADAMVMNHRVKIEDLIAKCPLDTDLIISSDLHGLNAGVFLLRNRQWSRDFLQAVDESKSEFISHKYPEQEAMDAILKDFNGKNGDYPVSYLPQWLLNQFWLQWIPGDFIIHHSGGSVEDKVKGLTPFLEKVQYATK
jgi:hypothetical protein